MFAVSVSFIERQNGSCFFFNRAINSKAVGISYYCDSSSSLDILPTNVFSGPRINVDEKFLNISVHRDHRGKLAEGQES